MAEIHQPCGIPHEFGKGCTKEALAKAFEAWAEDRRNVEKAAHASVDEVMASVACPHAMSSEGVCWRCFEASLRSAFKGHELKVRDLQKDACKAMLDEMDDLCRQLGEAKEMLRSLAKFARRNDADESARHFGDRCPLGLNPDRLSDENDLTLGHCREAQRFLER